jgi:hypothetical protein
LSNPFLFSADLVASTFPGQPYFMLVAPKGATPRACGLKCDTARIVACEPCRPETRTVQRVEEAWQKVREAKGVLLAEIEAALGCAAVASPPESM